MSVTMIMTVAEMAEDRARILRRIPRRAPEEIRRDIYRR